MIPPLRILLVAAAFAALVAPLAAVAEDRVQMIPASGHNPGVNDTLWVTDARVFNPNASEAITVWLAFLPPGADNSSVTDLSVEVSPRQAAALDDVVASLFGEAQAGAIRLHCSEDFLATSRTYNTGDGSSGTYGQFIPALDAEAAVARGILLQVANDPQPSGLRTNLGFVNPGLEPCTVTYEVYDVATATLLGSGSVTLGPLGFGQVNDVFDAVGAGDIVVPNASIEFSAEPEALAYVSVVDNTSGDPIFVLPYADTGTQETANNPPQGTITSPSGDLTVDAGDTVVFAGSASDPDGDEVAVVWDFGDGMTSAELDPGDHTYSDAGTYTVTLTATDDLGLADPTPDSRTITVQGANSPPDGVISQPTDNPTVSAGESVYFVAAVSDPDGDEVTVRWNFGDGMTSTDLEPGDHIFSDAGTYTVTLTATDDLGLADPTPDSRTVTVQGANSPPDGVISQPTDNPTVSAGESVYFVAAVSDPDGDEVTVLWDFGDGITSTQLVPGSHTFSDAGTYTVTLTATDEHGLSDSTPDSRTVTVNTAGVTLTQVQSSIFTPLCASCHGGSSPAVGLNLEAGQAHSNLVNVPATTQSGVRVVPFDPSSSVLVIELQSGHRSLPSSDIQAISDWISAGALNN